MKLILIFSILLVMNTPRTYPLSVIRQNPILATPANPQQTASADQLLGKWIAEDKNLEVEVFKKNGQYAARVVWFDTTKPGTPQMSEQLDTENPNPKLRSRPWLGLVVVNDLTYDNKAKEWGGGNIYDPNSGHTFRSVARLIGPGSLVVRGYWGVEFFGKSLNFSRRAK